MDVGPHALVGRAASPELDRDRLRAPPVARVGLVAAHVAGVAGRARIAGEVQRRQQRLHRPADRQRTGCHANPTEELRQGRAGQGGRGAVRVQWPRRDRCVFGGIDRGGAGAARDEGTNAGVVPRGASGRARKAEAISIGSTVMADLRSAPPLPMFGGCKKPLLRPSFQPSPLDTSGNLAPGPGLSRSHRRWNWNTHFLDACHRRDEQQGQGRAYKEGRWVHSSLLLT